MKEETKGLSFAIEDVTIHPNYERQAYQDIAVVKLKTSEGKVISSYEISIMILTKLYQKCVFNLMPST